MRIRLPLAFVLAVTSSICSASTMPSQWYHGFWRCNIDGRPARMTWRVVDDPQTSCDGEICSSSSGVAERGRFSDNGSRWVSLTNQTTRGDRLIFRHADGNRWYLDRVGRGQAVGQTTWQGQRYPLRCSRAGA